MTRKAHDRDGPRNRRDRANGEWRGSWEAPRPEGADPERWQGQPPPRLLKGQIDGRGLAPSFRLADKLQTRQALLPLQGLDDVAGAVGGAGVDHNDLKLLLGILAVSQVSQAPLDGARLAVGGDDDGKGGRVAKAHPLPLAPERA